MLLHWYSHPTQELSQCLGLRQPAWPPPQAPDAYRRGAGSGINVHFAVVLCRGRNGNHFCYSLQSYSNDEHSPEPRDMLRSSPSRSHRHSVGFVPTVYNGTLPPSEFLRCLPKRTRSHNNRTLPLTWRRACALSDSAHRGLAPCPAVTAVMRNPVYTVRSHRVHTSNCPSVASQICHQHTHTRFPPFHTCRLLDRLFMVKGSLIVGSVFLTGPVMMSNIF